MTVPAIPPGFEALHQASDFLIGTLHPTFDLIVPITLIACEKKRRFFDQLLIGLPARNAGLADANVK